MFPPRYKYYIVDYKLIVTNNMAFLVSWFISGLLALSFGFYMSWTHSDHEYETLTICFFSFLFLSHSYSAYKTFKNPIALEIDSKHQTILLRDKKYYDFRDVLWIEISPARSGGYTYDYLKLIFDQYQYAKVFQAKNSFFGKDTFAKDVAEEMAKMMGKEFKENP